MSLSSGETELHGICPGTAIGLGLKPLARDLGFHYEIKVHSDATAAIGIARRRGLGKIRHLHVSDLWVQDRLKRGDFTLSKIDGSSNPADILTKHVDRQTLEKNMKTPGLMLDWGRAANAPTLDHS